MCGIVGICNLDASPVEKKSIQAMCDSIRHRGPDDEGIALFNNIGIGMRRLSIIDLKSGHQPISNEDGNIWIVFNGEIYNYIELKDFLEKKGHTFKTNSDTECIIHLYEEYGTNCLEHLRGMFSFAIYDKKEPAIFIARDRLGIKPLFYYLDNNKLVFASEIKSILTISGIDKEIDFSAMDAFFTYTYIPAPKTIFKNIVKLEPGHFLLCKGKEVVKNKFWDLYYMPNYEKKEEVLIEEFDELFKKTVKCHMISDVPVGAFLSGGVDSGFVMALMSRYADEAVKAFTINFAGESGGYFDESIYAKEVAHKYKAIHLEYTVKPDFANIIDSIVESFDEPFADDSVIPTYHICRLSSKEVKVALTGLGGDEMFGGYDRYLGLKMSQIYNRIPKVLRKIAINPLIKNIQESKKDRERVSQLKRFITAADKPEHERYSNYISSFNNIEKHLLYNHDISNIANDGWSTEIANNYFLRDNATSLLDKAFYTDIKMYLPDDVLALSDRISMRHSLELRVPFVDHKIVEFCARIPAHFKIKWARKKYLLKKISASYIPSSVINHPKQGFASPMTSWIRHNIKEYITESLSKDRLSVHGFFNVDYVQNIISDHIARKHNNHKMIFSLLMFQKWYEKYMV